MKRFVRWKVYVTLDTPKRIRIEMEVRSRIERQPNERSLFEEMTRTSFLPNSAFL